MYDELKNEELVILAQKGDERVKNLLVKKNNGLIHYYALKFRTPKDLNYDDIVSSAYYGFSKAINTYDSTKGIKFITYAGTCMYNEIAMFFRANKKYINNLETSLDAPLKTADDNTLFLEDALESDIGLPQKELDSKVQSEELKYALGCLKSRERRIIISIYFEEKTQTEVAEEIGISQSYISRIIQRAEKNLKTIFENNA